VHLKSARKGRKDLPYRTFIAGLIEQQVLDSTKSDSHSGAFTFFERRTFIIVSPALMSRWQQPGQAQ
jgi:hypothetical protein